MTSTGHKTDRRRGHAASPRKRRLFHLTLRAKRTAVDLQAQADTAAALGAAEAAGLITAAGTHRHGRSGSTGGVGTNCAPKVPGPPPDKVRR
ncbi:hypothetical protein A3L23_05051 (plasmid) [Rhodococcoides fascians D188]|uniref:hypothetical protein n=1 Tax=Rhodococcoides fascians TaxID=1828 RepID=UPI0007AAE377|nr:hypothetical protein [Rhodococcus fascians]AMY56349.1 hypothetical protein A3L23_05051 [Rhodococcus fascians D188]